MYVVIEEENNGVAGKCIIIDEGAIEALYINKFIDIVYLDSEDMRRVVGKIIKFCPLLAEAYEVARERSAK